MKNKSRAIAPVIIAVILIVAIVVAGAVVYFVVMRPPAPGPGPAGFQITEIEDYGDLVNLVSHIKYQWTSSDEGVESIGIITFDDIGDEIVDGFNCRKLEIKIEANGDITEVTVWVDKSDWTTVRRLIIGDYEVPEGELPLYNYIGIFVLLPFTTFYGWGIAWAEVPPGVGTLISTGSATILYPLTSLLVNKWQFTPHPDYGPLEGISKIDVWQGQVDSYYLLTYFKVTEDDGDYFEFELLELET